MPDFVQRISTDADVAAWRASAAYARFVAWIKCRSERVKGRRLHGHVEHVEQGWEGIDEVGREVSAQERSGVEEGSRTIHS